MSNVAKAAERLIRELETRNEYVGDVALKEAHDTMILARWALPLLDSHPITEDWLRSVGFEPSPLGRRLDLRPWGFLGRHLSWVDPEWSDCWGGEVVFDGQRLPNPIKTRGSVRMLCEVLGIQLREPTQEAQ